MDDFFAFDSPDFEPILIAESKIVAAHQNLSPVVVQGQGRH